MYTFFKSNALFWGKQCNVFKGPVPSRFERRFILVPSLGYFDFLFVFSYLHSHIVRICGYNALKCNVK